MNELPPTLAAPPQVAVLSLRGGPPSKGRYGAADFSSKALRWLRVDPRLPEGAQQKLAIRACIEAGHGILLVLPDAADGEMPVGLSAFLDPLRQAEAAAVVALGSAPRAGALGQRVARMAESALLSAARAFVPMLQSADARAGLRAYDVAALARLPFERNADDARFSAQLLVQLRAAGSQVVERGVPSKAESYPSQELSRARELLRSAFAFKLHELGVVSDPRFELPAVYNMKASARSSHATLLELVKASPRRVLDVGCGQGELGHILRSRGHHVTGVDLHPPHFELDEFIQADLAQGLPIPSERRFDVIILADVLEHMAEPLPFLRAAVQHLEQGGEVLVSLPNAVHWSVRGQVAMGRFEYTNKGLLDRGHLRFFTRASAKRLFEAAGLAVRLERSTPVPWENVFPQPLRHTLAAGLETVDHALGVTWPNLFAYQHVFALVRRTAATRH